METVNVIIELFRPYYHYFFITMIIVGTIAILLEIIFKKRKK